MVTQDAQNVTSNYNSDQRQQRKVKKHKIWNDINNNNCNIKLTMAMSWNLTQVKINLALQVWNIL